MSARVKRQKRALRYWTDMANNPLTKRLRSVGLQLRKEGRARHVHKIWDMRNADGEGEYWEMFGWRVGRVTIPFSAPRRNSIQEMTTPAVLRSWAQFRR